MKTLYHIICDLTRARSGQGVPIKDKNGKVLLTAENQERRWVEHFKDMLNQQMPPKLFAFNSPAPDKDLAVNLNYITTTETTASIHLLKNNKVPGLDIISAQILKHGGPSIVEQLTTLLNRCWATAQVPENWQRGVIIKLPKKINLADCNNWRGITLLSVPEKVFCIVLLRRLREAVDKTLREEQAGICCGLSCSDQIFTLRNIIEQSL